MCIRDRGVTVGGHDLDQPFADIEDGYVERAAAQVEDEDALVVLPVSYTHLGGYAGECPDPGSAGYHSHLSELVTGR